MTQGWLLLGAYEANKHPDQKADKAVYCRVCDQHCSARYNDRSASLNVHHDGCSGDRRPKKNLRDKSELDKE